jgi:hypothetical protein
LFSERRASSAREGREGQLGGVTRYTYEKPSDPKWRQLMGDWVEMMPIIRQTLGGYDYPLIWTADFILDHHSNGTDAYRLGEINCSCVGFTTEPGLAEDIAEMAISVVMGSAGYPISMSATAHSCLA